MIKETIIKKHINFDNDLNMFDEKLSLNIKGVNILVIGGAGTIGSSYIKQILKYKPSKITVVDTNENGLTELTRDLRSSNLLDYNPEYITYPVNLLSDTFDKIFNSDTWQIVANFSAHKHVRSEKDKISVEALIKNNVYGAIKLLNLCELNPPKHFFSVSTDKAANPVNIMGASKSLMEKLILSKKKKFRVSTARFANVAFSNGSLLDGFIYRLNKKQPESGIYNVADDEAISTNELVRIIGEGSGKPARIVKFPKGLIMGLGKLGTWLQVPINEEKLQKLTENYVVSTTKILKALGTTLPITTKEGLRNTIQSFQKKE